MKNPVGVSTNTYHGFSTEQALRGIAAAGFQYVELGAVKGWTEHIMPADSDERVQEVKNLAKSLGLDIISLAGHCNLMMKERLEDFKDNIRLAKKLGCRYIVTSTGEAHIGKDEVFAEDVIVDNIKTVIPLLEEMDLMMVLEIHGEYGKSGEELMQICKKVGSPRCRVNYDTANVVLYAGLYPHEEVKTCADYVAYVHLKDKDGAPKDWNFPAVGKGKLKLLETMEYLNAHGYEGPYMIEIEYTQDFCMRDKDQPGDIDVANRAVKESYDYLKAHGKL
jgi:sugar phosphate isomerase/epimerase